MPKGEGMDALLIAAGPPELGGGKDEGSEGVGDAKTRAAERALRAISAKNAKGFASAFKDLYNICAAEHGSSGKGGDEGEEDSEEEY